MEDHLRRRFLPFSKVCLIDFYLRRKLLTIEQRSLKLRGLRRSLLRVRHHSLLIHPGRLPQVLLTLSQEKLAQVDVYPAAHAKPPMRTRTLPRAKKV